MSNGSSVWKWVAGITVAIMLAGAPGYIMLLQSPTRSEVDVIRERQQLVLQRIAVLEAQLIRSNEDRTELREMIHELLDRLEQHITSTG